MPSELNVTPMHSTSEPPMSEMEIHLPSASLWNSNMSFPRRCCAFRTHNQGRKNADELIRILDSGIMRWFQKPFNKPVADLGSARSSDFDLSRLSCESGLKIWEELRCCPSGFNQFGSGSWNFYCLNLWVAWRSARAGSRCQEENYENCLKGLFTLIVQWMSHSISGVSEVHPCDPKISSELGRAKGESLGLTWSSC